MKKILHIIHGLNLGGAENFIYNLLKVIDHQKFIFDFAIQEEEIQHKKFEELIIKTGGKIFLIADFFKNPISHAVQLKKVVSNDYDYVHIHMNAFINPIPAILSYHSKANVIIHSHSTQNGRGGKIGMYIHKINKFLFLKKSFIKLSCSDLASIWMFGNQSATIIPNAVNIKDYVYNNEINTKIRKQYSIENSDFVIGQIGRLIPLKNQIFSINLLYALNLKYPDLNAKLMLIGDGPMKDVIESHAKKLDIMDSIIMTGPIHNINEYYSVFDTFILPSLFEGLAVVLVEAQAAGLKILVSDQVSSQANITGSVKFISLNNINEWIISLYNNSKSYNRNNITEALSKSTFNINNMVKQMYQIYN